MPLAGHGGSCVSCFTLSIDRASVHIEKSCPLQSAHSRFGIMRASYPLLPLTLRPGVRSACYATSLSETIDMEIRRLSHTLELRKMNPLSVAGMSKFISVIPIEWSPLLPGRPDSLFGVLDILIMVILEH